METAKNSTNELLPSTVLENLEDRAKSLEFRLGNSSTNDIKILESLIQLQETLSVIRNAAGGNMKTMHMYLNAFRGNSSFDPKEAQVWFQTHYSEILNLINNLTLLETSLGDNLNRILSSFGTKLPGSFLEVAQLHDITRNVIQLVVKSFLIVNRFISMSIEKEKMILNVESRINKLRGVIEQLENERTV
ncbi:unnamed protein product [Kluyveromyces dobzhanskii CBS 2104]|uniref:WGS project CCBQ000000000 data, contig 00051 n=1 Tax=Kluyveromyces dobzhanskii CBS 2104 TaxID=1427455 RepID=A0A0A8L799_9SACH|nr:unnamed protein product [Kluyveromyces dobzhanskii CBS 2104]